MSRSIEDLAPEMIPLADAFIDAMNANGIPFIFTCTYRSQDEQDALYELGRTRPGRKVTWTRNSKHTQGIAFDIVPIDENRKPLWDDNELWDRIGEIGESVGLEWGGRWVKSDRPHFQKPESDTVSVPEWLADSSLKRILTLFRPAALTNTDAVNCVAAAGFVIFRLTLTNAPISTPLSTITLSAVDVPSGATAASVAHVTFDKGQLEKSCEYSARFSRCPSINAPFNVASGIAVPSANTVDQTPSLIRRAPSKRISFTAAVSNTCELALVASAA